MGYRVKLPTITNQIDQQDLSYSQQTGDTGDSGNKPIEGTERIASHSEYSRLAHEALRKIEHPDLPGMIRWLEKANPALYNTLQKDLLNQIDLLWQQGVPIDEFQEMLDHWVKVHLQACHLYAQAV